MNRSIGDTALIGGACMLACWTIFSYVMVLAESGFSDLVKWSFLPVVCGLMLVPLGMDKLLSTKRDYARPSRAQDSEAVWPGRYFWLIPLFVVSIVTLRIVGAPYWSAWIALLSTSILVFRMAPHSSGLRDVQVTPVWVNHRTGITALIVLGAILVAITHRPDLDDSQYLNFVVTALDFPLEPLYSHSGLWLDHNVPLELPIYRFHSYELLVAALSQISRVDHKVFYYLILPPLFGGIAILVHWRLAQHLMPQHAVPVVLAWVVLIVALGESHRAFGNFSFVRLFQGKALLVSVGIPLCLYLGLRFAEIPGWRRAVALELAVLASLGMSTSALITVPIVVAAALAGGLPGATRAHIKRIVVGGLAASLFLVATGVFLAIGMGVGDRLYGDSLPSAGNGLSIVLGEGILGAMVLALFPVAPLFVSSYHRRRAYAATTLCFVALAMNPWLAPFLARMFDLALQWRLFWSVPLVFSAAVAMAGLAALLAEKISGFARLAVLPMALVAAMLISTRLSISPANGVVVALPTYKVEPLDHAIADEIVRSAPPKSIVYAPISVAAWITTFRHHPYPLVVRPDYFYFGSIRQYIGVEELYRRHRVIRFLGGQDREPSTPAFFQAQLESDRPSVVAYESDLDMAPVIGAILGTAGYTGKKQGHYWLWQSP